MSKPHPESRKNKGKFRLEKTPSGARFVLAREGSAGSLGFEEIPPGWGAANIVDERPASASIFERQAPAGHDVDLKLHKNIRSRRATQVPLRAPVQQALPARTLPRQTPPPRTAPQQASSPRQPEFTPASSYGFRLNVPTIIDPTILSPVLQDGRSEVQAGCKVDGREIYQVPVCVLPLEEEGEADSPSAGMPEQAKPGPVDSGWTRPLARVAMILFLMGLVAVLLHGPRTTPTENGTAGSKAGGQVEMATLSPARHSRLFERGLDGAIQKYLTEGYYVGVERNEDGTMSNRHLYEDMISKDLATVQELARIKSQALEKPLFIIGGTPPQVIDRVNPGDRVARREYMMLVWSLKQDALHLSKQRYQTRDALDRRRTVATMSRFIQDHPDSRMVASALKDMRHVCYFGLQDPDKFLTVAQSLVNQALTGARGSEGAPELARVIGPYLKEAVNQVLYQRIHRLESSMKPAESGGEAFGAPQPAAPAAHN